jgi:D-sedoheptulose 7-phosphate isomerase
VSDREIQAVRAACGEAADLHRRVAAEQAEIVVRAARVIADALLAGRQVLVFGNGGSATDAQHFAAEFVGRFLRDRRAVPVMALTADTAVLTSLGNDYGYEAVFARQVDAFGRAGDVALGITTSGTSRNVNVALERARARGLVTIGLTGRDGGDTAKLVDVHLNVAGRTTARIQEVHRTLLHVICELVEPQL